MIKLVKKRVPGHPEKLWVMQVKNVGFSTFWTYFTPSFSEWPGALFFCPILIILGIRPCSTKRETQFLDSKSRYMPHCVAKTCAVRPVCARRVSEKVFASQERVSGFPEKGADLRGSPENFWESPGNFRGSLGNFRETSGEKLLSSTVSWKKGKEPPPRQDSASGLY